MAKDFSAPPGLPLPPGQSSADTPQTTGGAMPSSPPPNLPHWQARAASLLSEYVAGGGWTYLNTYIRALPQWIDDSTRDFGDDLYEQMLLDPQINSSIRLLKLSTLSNGVRIDPAVEYEPNVDPYETEDITVAGQARDSQGRYLPKHRDQDRHHDEDDDEQLRKDSELAAEIADFCHENLENLEDRSFVDILFEMLDALAVGNRIAEKVCEVRDMHRRGPMLCLKSLKVKPRRSYSFVVDPFMNVQGLMTLMPGTAYPVTTGSIIADPQSVPNLLPREKFAVLSWSSQNNDPRGSSLLRQIYNPWWLKRQVWGEYARYLSQFAGPSLIGTTAQGAQPSLPTDHLGNPIIGAPPITPEQAMLNALIAFKNGTAVAFPYGSTVNPLQMSGDGSAFKSAIELFDKQIAKGILCQTLATEEGEHQARAAAQMHQDVLDMVVLHIKAVVAGMIRRDIMYWIVRYNWGEKVAARLTPHVHLAETERHNLQDTASAIASLVACGYLDKSQWPEMDARVGLPKRKPQQQQSMGGGQPAGFAAFTGRGAVRRVSHRPRKVRLLTMAR